jgi:hypothetical protein
MTWRLPLVPRRWLLVPLAPALLLGALPAQAQSHICAPPISTAMAMLTAARSHPAPQQKRAWMCPLQRVSCTADASGQYACPLGANISA